MAIIINTPRAAQSTSQHPHAHYDTDSQASGSDVESDSDTSMGGAAIASAPKKQSRTRTRATGQSIVTPGEPISDDPKWMRGHGTHIPNPSTTGGAPTITASVAGTIARTNKLLSVTPLRARYAPEIGDLVVGRVVEVQARRWRVDVGAAQLATLQLSAINLPGGALRRRTDTDELQIRAFFAEGDALVCEVQQLHGDGMASLHARSLRYGKLRNGVFVAVPGGLSGVATAGGGVVRAKRHVWTMDVDAAGVGGGKVDVVLGVNGFVWVCKHVAGGVSGDDAQAASAQGAAAMPGLNRMEEAVSSAAYSSQNERIDAPTMREISRIRSVIVALAENGLRVDEDMVRRGYAEAVELGRETDEDDIYLGGERGKQLAAALGGGSA